MRESAEGLRPCTRRIEPEGLAGHFRVVALGDSITHGMSLPLERTYPQILTNLLQSHSKQPVIVINAGIAGQTVIQGLQRMWRDVIRYRPHVTLIAFGLNDASLRRRRQDASREREIASIGPLGVLNRLHLYRTCKAWARRFGVTLGLYAPLDYDAAPSNEPRTSPRAYRIALRRLVKEVRTHGGGDVWLLTTHPVNERDHQSGDCERQRATRHTYNEIVRAVAGETHVGLIDVEKMFTENGPTDVLQADGVHLNEAGQRYLAECIYDTLKGRRPVSHRSEEADAEVPDARS
jgi:lysophospholipase L1-like esterase